MWLRQHQSSRTVFLNLPRWSVPALLSAIRSQTSSTVYYFPRRGLCLDTLLDRTRARAVGMRENAAITGALPSEFPSV